MLKKLTCLLVVVILRSVRRLLSIGFILLTPSLPTTRLLHYGNDETEHSWYPKWSHESKQKSQMQYLHLFSKTRTNPFNQGRVWYLITGTKYPCREAGFQFPRIRYEWTHSWLMMMSEDILFFSSRRPGIALLHAYLVVVILRPVRLMLSFGFFLLALIHFPPAMRIQLLDDNDVTVQSCYSSKSIRRHRESIGWTYLFTLYKHWVIVREASIFVSAQSCFSRFVRASRACFCKSSFPS